MADLVVIVGVIAFFAICVLVRVGVDRLIGPDRRARGAVSGERAAARRHDERREHRRRS